MKKNVIIVASFLLTACSGNDNTNVEVNTGEQSSVVETTNPQTNTEEHHAGDGHDHGDEVEGITSIEYVEMKHDFGNVIYPSDNPYTFKFKNTGNSPLVIKDAKASCGCTIPNKPEEPIMPGEMGEIDIIFRPKEGQVGQFVTKEITVTANTNP